VGFAFYVILIQVGSCDVAEKSMRKEQGLRTLFALAFSVLTEPSIAAFEEVLPLWVQPAAAAPPAEYSRSYATIEALPATQ
jgi:hypothetical protein